MIEPNRNYDRCPNCKCFGFVKNRDASWCVACRFRVTHNQDWANLVIANDEQAVGGRDGEDDVIDRSGRSK